MMACEFLTCNSITPWSKNTQTASFHANTFGQFFAVDSDCQKLIPLTNFGMSDNLFVDRKIVMVAFSCEKIDVWSDWLENLIFTLNVCKGYFLMDCVILYNALFNQVSGKWLKTMNYFLCQISSSLSWIFWAIILKSWSSINFDASLFIFWVVYFTPVSLCDSAKRHVIKYCSVQSLVFLVSFWKCFSQ